MRSFSDFKIKPKNARFVGDKIRIMRVINREIVVHDFKLNESKFKNTNSDKCLNMQIEFEGEKRVLFTGSKVLSEMIQQVPLDEMPFKTVITKEGETFKFN